MHQVRFQAWTKGPKTASEGRMPTNYIFYTHLREINKNMRIKTEKYYQFFPKGRNNCFLILFGAPSGLKGLILAAYRANFK